MKKIVSSFLIVTLVLMVRMQVSAPAQSTQHKASNLDFIARMNQQATTMYRSANELDVRLKSFFLTL